MIYIYTTCYNTPEYIDIQYKLLKKFIKNNFEYIVFNNTMTNTVISDIDKHNNKILKNICLQNNIELIDIPRNIFKNIKDTNASRRVGIAIDWSNKFLFNKYSLNSIFFLIDTDAFLLTDFDIESFMYQVKLSGREQYRKSETNQIKYISNHIVIYRPIDLNLKHFSFMPCKVENILCDCGGNTNYILHNLKDSEFINWKNYLLSEMGNKKNIFAEVPLSKYTKDYYDSKFIDSLDNNIKQFIKNDSDNLDMKNLFCEIFSNEINNVMFLHLRAGTNWYGYDFNKRQKNIMYFLNSLLEK